MDERLAKHFMTADEWAMWETYVAWYRAQYREKHHENNGDRGIEHHTQRIIASKQRKEAS